MTTSTPTLAQQITALLPAHTYRQGGTCTWTWTTPRGLWCLTIETGLSTLFTGTTTTIIGLGVTITMRGINVDRIAATLRLHGAINDPEQPITDDDYATQILSQTLTDEPECQRCLADDQCPRCHGYGQIHGRICADCTEAAEDAAQP